MFNITQVKYSILHNKAIKLLARKYGLLDDEFTRQIENHDMDKVIGYLQDSILSTHKKHVKNSPHHVESNLEDNDNNNYETILDWDSSRYTKPDKPLNAYQTLNAYYEPYIDRFLPLLRKLGIDNEDCSMDEEIVEKLNATTITDEEVLDVVAKAIKTMRSDEQYSYLDFDKLIASVYQSLSKEEQDYFKKIIGQEEIERVLKEKKKIRIGLFTHKGCDYDAMCSTITMAEYISSLTNNEDVEVVVVMEPNSASQKIKSNIKTYTQEEVQDMEFDCALVCDVNEQDRIYGLEKVNSVPIDRRYVIDHHDKNREEIEMLNTNKMNLPKYSSTCEVVAELLMYNGYQITPDMAHNLYLGMASDTSAFERNVTSHTQKIASALPLSLEEKQQIVDDLTRMSEEQETLYNKIKEYPCSEKLRIYTLLEPEEAGDITKLLKHKKFDELTGPTVDNPVTCFIIGIGNNYFIKFKKNPDCDVDILTISTNCNGGGHETRCAGRFYNTDFDTVLDKILEEYRKTRGKVYQKK